MIPTPNFGRFCFWGYPKFCLEQSCSSMDWGFEQNCSAMATQNLEGTATWWGCKIKQNWLQEPIEGAKHMSQCLHWSVTAMLASACAQLPFWGCILGLKISAHKSQFLKFHHPLKNFPLRREEMQRSNKDTFIDRGCTRSFLVVGFGPRFGPRSHLLGLIYHQLWT